MMNDYSIKSIRKQFKDNGVFYTPPELAEFLKSLIPGSPAKVYDPTCGHGSLLSVFGDEVEKFGQDIDPLAVADAEQSLKNFHGASGDVFTSPAWIDERFDAIVGNPPFSVRWEPQADERFMAVPTVPTAGKADYAFLIHILHMLSDTGTAAVLNFPGILYRGGREGQLRQWMVQENFIDQVIHIPGSTFTDTAISTVCLVMKKNRTSETVKFIDRESGLERDVAISEIAENDFSLSVGSYVRKPEVEREQFDAWGVEQAARRGLVRKLRAEIQFSCMVSEFEKFPMTPFLDDIQMVVDEFREKVA